MKELTVQEILLKNIGPIKFKRKRPSRWMPVRGYERFYLVCESGKVKSKKAKRGQRYAKSKIIKTNKDKTVELCDAEGKRKKFPLKKLVADHWFHPPTNYRNIELKDGDPFNCAVSNMRIKGVKRFKFRKYSDEQIDYIVSELEKNKGVKGFQKKLAKELGIDKSVISYIGKGRRPKDYKGGTSIPA